MELYLAIDLGTTGCRSIVFDSALKEVSSAYAEYPLLTGKNSEIEQDAEEWWRLTLKTAKAAISAPCISPEHIDGISVSAQGISVVPVDETCKPLRSAISWLDTRATAEAENVKHDFGAERIRAITGKLCDPVYTLPKILWIRQNQNEIFERAYKFLMPLDFLTAKLTGNFVTDHSMASGTMMYDLARARWCGEILDRYGIAAKKLPRLAYTGEAAGNVLPEIAKMLGLKKDCIVAVGAQDQKCAAHGAGLCDSNVTVSLGTAAAVMKKWDKPGKTTAGHTTWCAYTEPDTWVTEGVVNTAGTCLRWLRDTVFRGEEYSVIDSEAAQSLDSGSDLMFLPFMGDREGAFYGLSLGSTRGDLAASVMEGVAFEIRAILEEMDTDTEKQKIVLFGGGVKSDLWCRIISNVTGAELLVPATAEAAGAGAARAAARALGRSLDPLPVGKRYLPSGCDPERYYNYLERRNGAGK